MEVVMPNTMAVRALVVAVGAITLGCPAMSTAHAARRVPCQAPVATTGGGSSDTAGKVPTGTTGKPDATCGDAAQSTVDRLLPSTQNRATGFEDEVRSKWGDLCEQSSGAAKGLKSDLAGLGMTKDEKALPGQPPTEQDRLDKATGYLSPKECVPVTAATSKRCMRSRCSLASTKAFASLTSSLA
jgi:hypothetical protein